VNKLGVKAKNLNTDKRARTIKGVVVDHYRNSSSNYPDNIWKCPRCNVKLPASRFFKWDNDLAKMWVVNEEFLECYDKWHLVNVCDECFASMMAGCGIERASHRGMGSCYNQRLQSHRRVLR